MPKARISRHKSTKLNQVIEQSKAISSKNKNLKLYKSIQKTQQFTDSQYLVKPLHLRQQKINTAIKGNNFLAKLQRSSEANKKVEEDYYNYGKKLYSDQQSTHANALFESGEIYQNFIQKSKAKQQQVKNQREQKPLQKQNDKNRSSSESKIVRESLKNRLAGLKVLQQRQQEQMEEHKLKSTAGEVHRLQKIQAIERKIMEQEMGKLQIKMKQKSDIKAHINGSVKKI